MTHEYFQTVVGVDNTSAGDDTKLKWEYEEDSGRYYVSFPDDQYRSPVGMIGDLALGVVFLCFRSVLGPLIVHWMMYGLFTYCVKWQL